MQPCPDTTQRCERLRALNALPVMVWVADTSKRCTYFNRAWLAFTGRTLPQEQGDGWADGVHPDDLARCLHVYQSAFDARQPFQMTYRLRRADGQYRWLLDQAQPEHDDHGAFIGYVGTCTDVTDQHRTSEELRRLLEMSPDLVCAAHTSGYYHHVNPAFTQLLGWTEAELLKQPLLDFVHPQDMPKTIQAMAHLLDNQRLIDFENRLRCRDGGFCWIEWRASAPNDDGLIYAIGRDVTKRRRTASLLGEVEQLAKVGAWELDFATERLFWSPQTFRIHDLPPDAPQPTLAAAIAFYAPEARATIEAAVRAAMQTSQGWQLELPLITAQGREIWVIALGRVEVIDGVPARAYGAFQDITDRRRAEESQRTLEARVAHAQKLELLGTFAGGIAHDFNKVLAAITSNLEVVIDNFAPLASVVQMAQQARGFVEQLLTFSRQQEPPKGALRLQDALQDILRMVPRMLPANVRFTADLHPDTPPILAHTSQLYQLIINLCTNAADAIGQRDGLITLTLQPVEAKALPLDLWAKFAGGTHACLTIRDDGAGMDAATLAAVFEAFFTTKGDGGTGLGLFVVQSIMQSLGGAVRAESVLGEGSAFSLFFQAAPPQTPRVQPPTRHLTPQPLSAPPAPPPSLEPARRLRVLLADDEAMLLNATTRLLRGQGFEVEAFSDSAAALAALRSRGDRYDLAILDVNMPGPSGVDIVRVISEHLPSLPVLVVSGFLNDDIQHQLRALGARAVLPKPWLSKDLFAAISALLHQGERTSDA